MTKRLEEAEHKITAPESQVKRLSQGSVMLAMV